MKNYYTKIAISSLLLMSQLMSSQVLAADTATASLNISGNVPTVFSVTTRGIPGDLDLTPGVSVADRLLGIIHLKYNVNVASLKIASTTASGKPEDGGAVAYGFGAGGFKVKVTAGCSSVAVGFNALFALVAAGTDVKSAASAALANGVEEDCSLTASWDGSAAALPLAGKYSMGVVVTFVSI